MSCHSRQDGAEDGDVDSGSGGCRFETALYSMFLYLQVHRCRSGVVTQSGVAGGRLGTTKVHFICGVLSNVGIHSQRLLLKFWSYT